jgi:hypothetical protein
VARLTGCAAWIGAALLGSCGCDLARSDLPPDGGSGGGGQTSIDASGGGGDRPDAGSGGSDGGEGPQDAVGCGMCPEVGNGASVCTDGGCQTVCNPGHIKCLTGTSSSCYPAGWDFESGTTEGWTNDFSVPRSNGLEAVRVDTFAFAGAHSLWQTATPPASAVGAIKRLCDPGAIAADLRGKRVTLWYRLSGLFSTSSVFSVCAVRTAGMTMLDCVDAADKTTGIWSSIALPLTDPGNEMVTAIAVRFVTETVGDNVWRYNIDNVQIE